MACERVLAKSRNYNIEGRHNPQHIDNLPAEIANSIFRKCHTILRDINPRDVQRVAWRPVRTSPRPKLVAHS